MRNRTLDMVKAICAYAVVLLHVHFPGNAGIIANVLARLQYLCFLWYPDIFVSVAMIRNL